MNDKLKEELREAGYMDLSFKSSGLLSQLIEACGEKGKYFELGESTVKWYARIGIDEKSPRTFLEEYGKTPEEAVARLWLALNKK